MQTEKSFGLLKVPLHLLFNENYLYENNEPKSDVTRRVGLSHVDDRYEIIDRIEWRTCY